MPALTFDGRSFMIDGRRIWLVSGSVPYARIPHEYWAERIHAASVAGLNTIETPVFWNRHEPRPGHFDFKGDNDLRQFVQLCAQAGMYCILRIGPFVGQDWDFGGLPPWLTAVKNIKFRAMNGPFLEACSRYISAVSDQVRDLQITTPGKGPHAFNGAGGPIVLLQAESQWTCGDEAAANSYLGELGRYLRESGFNVPVVNSNNLWAGVESELDGWTGSGDMLGTVRQLAAVRPDQPRMIIEFNGGEPATWGVNSPERTPPDVLEHRLAQILVAGGQFNLHPFCGGTNFGFWGGRRAEAPISSSGFVAAAADSGSPLNEAGERGPSYDAVRRMCTFASRFGRIFSNLDPTFQPVAILPGHEEADRVKKSPITVVHATGTQGGVAFLFSQSPSPGPVTLILPEGTTLPVDVGDSPVSWCVFNANLGGRSRLDYCGFSVFGLVGKVLVVFGSAGIEGRLSINGTPLITTVPKGGKSPSVIEHEGMTVVVCSREQVSTIFLTDDAVFIGASGLTSGGHPLSLEGAKHCTRISAEGEVKQVLAVHPMVTKKSERIAISDWTAAAPHDYADGTSARYASIDGASDLTTLGCPFGYGWYRIRVKSANGGGAKTRIAMPHSGDRLHVYLDGEFSGLIGDGPGATSDLSLTLKKGTHTLVVLAENLGRLAGGADLGEAKGLYGDIWEVKPIRAGKAVIKSGDPFDPLTFRSPLFEVQPGDMTLSDRITWTIQHKKKQQPIIVTIPPLDGRAILMVNNKPAAFIDRGLKSRIVLGTDHLKGGANLIQFAILPDDASDPLAQIGPVLTEGVEFFEGVAALSAKAEWAFAKWEQPKAAAFKAPKSGGNDGHPCWWRSTFKLVDTHSPVYFDAAGLTKGQLYVNGRHVCRYFVATAGGKAVPPQSLYAIPGAWLNSGEDNEITIFDEHGASPARCKLHHGA